MACIYINFSKSINKFYIGSSRENNAQKRFASHNTGKVRSTKSGRPWALIHQEIYKNYTEGRKRELFLKTGMGRKWIKEKFGHYKQN